MKRLRPTTESESHAAKKPRFGGPDSAFDPWKPQPSYYVSTSELRIKDFPGATALTLPDGSKKHKFCPCLHASIDCSALGKTQNPAEVVAHKGLFTRCQKCNKK